MWESGNGFSRKVGRVEAASALPCFPLSGISDDCSSRENLDTFQSPYRFVEGLYRTVLTKDSEATDEANHEHQHRPGKVALKQLGFIHLYREA